MTAGADGGDADPGPNGDRVGDTAGESPDVEDLDHPVLLFDGVCNLCNAFVRFVVRFDAEGRFLFAPLQSDVGRELRERCGRAAEDLDTVVLIEDGACYEKSTAALRVARHLDGPWPLLYPLVLLPERLRNRLYDLVAEYRYRVFGTRESCPVPDPELRERFEERTLE